ncbi:hypothetical protein BZA77DRAFT_121471 [Pyronema omphalodes]|nr:hypothetical protein BZA77DRAFT_121471 [Pyronema omphalodes]
MIEAVEKGLPQPRPKEKIWEALQEVGGDPQRAIEYIVNGSDCESEESGSEFDSEEDEGYETKQQNLDVPDSSSLKQISSDPTIRDKMVVQYPRKMSKAYPTVPDDPAQNPQLVSKILEQTIAAHLFRNNPKLEEIQVPTVAYMPPEVTPSPVDNPSPFVNPTSRFSQSYVAKCAKPTWPAEITGLGEPNPSMHQAEDSKQALHIDPVTGESSTASAVNLDVEHGRLYNFISSQWSAEPVENGSFIYERKSEEPRVNANVFAHSNGTESLQNTSSVSPPQSQQVPQTTPILQQPLPISAHCASTSPIVNPAPDQGTMEMGKDNVVTFIWEAPKNPAMAATQPKPQTQPQEHEIQPLCGSVFQTTMQEMSPPQTLEEVYQPPRTSQGSQPPQPQPIFEPQTSTNESQQLAAHSMSRASQNRTPIESSASQWINPLGSPHNQPSNSPPVSLTPPFTSIRHPLPPAPIRAPKLSALERLRPVRHTAHPPAGEHTKGRVRDMGIEHGLPPAPIRPPTLKSLKPAATRVAPVAQMGSISPPAPSPSFQSARRQAPVAPMASMSSSSSSSNIPVSGALPGHVPPPAARPQISRAPFPAIAYSWSFPDSYPEIVEEVHRRKRCKLSTGSAIHTGLTSGIPSVLPMLSSISPSKPCLGNTTTRTPIAGLNSHKSIGLNLGGFDTIPSLNSGRSPVPRSRVRRIKDVSEDQRIPGSRMRALSSPKIPGLSAGDSMSRVSAVALSGLSRSSSSNIVDDNCSVTSNFSNVSTSTSATTIIDNEAGKLDTRKRQRPVTTEYTGTSATFLNEATTPPVAVEKAAQATEDDQQAIARNLSKWGQVGGPISGEQISASTTTTTTSKAANSDNQNYQKSNIFRTPNPFNIEDEEMGDTIVLKPSANPTLVSNAEAGAHTEARANKAHASRRAPRASRSRATPTMEPSPISYSGLDITKSRISTKPSPASTTADPRTSQTPVTSTAPLSPMLHSIPDPDSAKRRSSRIKDKKAEPKEQKPDLELKQGLELEPQMENKRRTTKNKKSKKAVQESGVTKSQTPTRRSTRKGRGRNRYRELYV